MSLEAAAFQWSLWASLLFRLLRAEDWRFQSRSWSRTGNDGARGARCPYRKQVVDGLYQLDDRAILDGFYHFLDAIDVMGLPSDVQGAAHATGGAFFVQYLLMAMGVPLQQLLQWQV
jgi:hypothetical protein